MAVQGEQGEQQEAHGGKTHGSEGEGKTEPVPESETESWPVDFPGLGGGVRQGTGGVWPGGGCATGVTDTRDVQGQH